MILSADKALAQCKSGVGGEWLREKYKGERRIMRTKVKLMFTKIIPVRFTVELWRKVMRCASLDGLKPSVWIRMKIHEITKEGRYEERV